MSTLNDLLASILERGARLVEWSSPKTEQNRSIKDLCMMLMSSKGEASGVALAAQILHRYDAFDARERLSFFQLLANDYDIDADRLSMAAAAYTADRSGGALKALARAATPRRQELLRRLNFAPGGTHALVQMRTHLLRLLREHPELEPIDTDFHHLLSSWFNRGFLVLQPIDWNSSALILEKIIAYEAVHEIDSWEELRRRLQPADRRCFAFFHPAMPDEPLIFVEVALTTGIAGNIQEVLAGTRDVISPGEATTAVFYSISNCQEGLRGISFGAFLIKQVAQDLARALTRLETFVTLSPVPGLTKWIRDEARREPDGLAAEVAGAIADLAWARDPARVEILKPKLMTLAARYFLDVKRDDGQPIDPVARFHLGNGASLARINWMADGSAKGLAQSAGIMVNYLYELNAVEAYHEAYAEERKIQSSKAVRALLPKA
ncbi:MAG: malonyl-CoA decarboxylase [Neomegalonema sp.]|nr:malonyl-CoA decarboxylase [Neomegalonema sp.]